MSVSQRDSNAPPPPTPLTPAEIRAYLEYEMEAVLRRRDQIVAALEAGVQAYPSITTEGQLGDVAENVRMAKALVRIITTRRKETKEPFLEGGRVIDRWFAALMQPLNDAVEPVQDAMDDYGKRQEEAERARLAEIARTAREQQQRALAKAAESMEQNRPDSETRLAEASEASEAAAHAAEAAGARPAELTRSYGPLGAVTSITRRWKIRVVDAGQVPRNYLMADQAKLDAAMKSAPKGVDGKPICNIAGTEVYSVDSMRVR